MVTFSSIDTPIGEIFIASTIIGICKISLGGDDKEFFSWLKTNFADEKIVEVSPQKICAVSAIRDFLDGKIKEFNILLDIRGTSFQKKVWRELRKIPYGKTCSYKEVAEAIGMPKSWRAVGQANGANPLPIVIPCHRVIAADGSPGGYSGGIKIKSFLLNLEKRNSR